MPMLNEQWGKCIRKHLDARGLSLRGAEAKAGGHPVSTTWMDWRNNKVPRDYALAQSALEKVLGIEAAIECLQAAGLPVPAGWAEPDALSAEIAGRIAEIPSHNQPVARKQVLEFVEKMAAKYKAGQPFGGVDIDEFLAEGEKDKEKPG